MSAKLFVCPHACGYSCTRKYNLELHLNRKRPCTHRIPTNSEAVIESKEETSEITDCDDTSNRGWLYLFRTCSKTDSNMSIYKIGQTSNPNLKRRLRQFKGRQKILVLLYAVLEENHTDLEQFVLKDLRLSFETVDGREFFACVNDTLITNRVKIAVAKWNTDIHRWISHCLPPESAKVVELSAENQKLRDLAGKRQTVWKCHWCKKTFARNNSWNRHMRDRCKVKTAMENTLQEELKKNNATIDSLEEVLKEKDGRIRELEEEAESKKSTRELEAELTARDMRIRDLEMRLELV